MTRQRDPERLISEFLQDGLTELPDRAYDAVRSSIEHTRQRVVFGPWKEEQVSRYAKLALAAAAVLAVAVIGLRFLPTNGEIGVQPTATLSPSPSPTEPPPARQRPTSGALTAGTYYFENKSLTNVTRLTFAVPNGWEIPDFDALVAKEPGAPGEVMFGAWVVSHIFTDACQWNELSIVDVGTTTEELMTALAGQQSRTASPVTETTVGGYAAKRIELTVSPTLDPATCTNGVLRYWPGAGPDFGGGMCCNPTGNIDVVYAVDVAGKRTVIVARHYPGSSSQSTAELQGLIDSIQITP